MNFKNSGQRKAVMASLRLKGMINYTNPGGFTFDVYDYNKVNKMLPSAQRKIVFIDKFKKSKMSSFRVIQDVASEGKPGTVSITTLANINKEKGFHWFDKDSMNFFKSRFPKTGLTDGKGNAYFISSESLGFAPSEGRGYSIRKMEMNTGKMDTIGGFNVFSSRSSAMSAMNKLIKKDMKQ